MTVFTLILSAALHCPAANAEQPGAATPADQHDSCGVTSLYLLCRYRGMEVDYSRVAELLGPAAPDGTHSFHDLTRAAEQFGLHGYSVSTTREGLASCPLPAIAQIHIPAGSDPQGTAGRDGRSHFVLLLRSGEQGVHVLDPPHPLTLVPWDHFTRFWTGKLLLFSTDRAEVDRVRSEHLAGSAVRLVARLLAAGGIVAAAVWLVLLVSRLDAGSRARLRRHGRLAGWVAAGLVVTVGGVLASQAVPATPVCQFPPDGVNLGRLVGGKQLVRVPVTNAGGGELRVTKIGSNCVCAQAAVPLPIPAGMSGDIEVTLHVSPGPGQTTLTVSSNDPAGKREVTLKWVGPVTPLVTPRRVVETAQALGSTYERRVRVSAFGSDLASFTVEKATCAEGAIEVEPVGEAKLLGRSAFGGNLALVERDLVVRVRPPAVPAVVESECRFKVTSVGVTEEVVLPVSVKFVGRLVPEVDSAALTWNGSAQEGTRRTVRVSTGDPKTRMSVKNVPSWLNCEVEREGATALLRLRLAGPPPDTFTPCQLELVEDGTTHPPVPFTVYGVRAR